IGERDTDGGDLVIDHGADFGGDVDRDDHLVEQLCLVIVENTFGIDLAADAYAQKRRWGFVVVGKPDDRLMLVAQDDVDDLNGSAAGAEQRDAFDLSGTGQRQLIANRNSSRAAHQHIFDILFSNDFQSLKGFQIHHAAGNQGSSFFGK